MLLPARLTRWKGQMLLLAALARMQERRAVAVLVGDAQGRRRYVAALAARARALGISERLRLAGHCEDMPAALALADVVVNASLLPEPFGRTIIEAQAMRRLVIAADHGGAAETIADGITGWRVAPGDPAALAAALDAALALSGGGANSDRRTGTRGGLRALHDGGDAGRDHRRLSRAAQRVTRFPSNSFAAQGRTPRKS